MALNLLSSSYGSDDDLSDCDTEPSSSAAAPAEEQVGGSNPLLASEDCSDTNSSDEDSETDSSPKKPPPKSEEAPRDEPPPKRRLPSADDLFKIQIKTGVMVNEYERARMEHEARLSRHVKMTDPVKKKPLCKAFRRGNCTRGKNCRYEHPEEPKPAVPPNGTAAASAPVYKGQEQFNRARPPKARF